MTGTHLHSGHWTTWPWRSARQFSQRTPLRVKLITLLLGLVAVALAVIGFVTVVVFTGYLQNQDDSQVQTLYGQVQEQIGNSSSLFAPHTHTYVQNTNVVELLSSSGAAVSWFGNASDLKLPPPVIPTSQSWLTANAGHLATVPATAGDYKWRVIVEPAQYANANTSQPQSGLLVVGVNLFNIDQTIAYLTRLDVVVSAVILLVLVVVGIAVVQANLRPLNDIEMTAGEIARGHLNHRIPERDPRTEIGRLGRSLNTMLSQIETAFHAREESERAAHQSEERMRRFIADASHELRTPLTTIRGFAAHYRQRGGAGGAGGTAGAGGSRHRAYAGGGVSVGGEDQIRSPGTDLFVPGSPAGSSPGGAAGDGMSPADLDHLMGRVESEATRMGLLVEDLLTLARLDQQRPLNFAPVDLLTLAVDTVQDARIVSPDRQIDLIVAPGTAFLVDGDEPRLRQVLANLVNNALTHTPAGTPVRVRIASGTLLPSSDDQGSAAGARPAPAVVLDVTDDGPGMTAEQAQRVFERFYRADAARNRASGGSGLGLAIVAGLVKAHGGTVSVRTALGEGADFEVRLPLSPDAVALDDPDAELPPVG